MNLADSLIHVLKHKSHLIVSEFWKRDLKIILTNFGQDILELYQAGNRSLQNIRHQGVNFSFKEMSESLSDSFLIIRIMPGRVREAFGYFKDDLLAELSQREDAKSKAVFSLKILGTLTRFVLGIFYQVKRGQAEFRLKGLRHTNAFTKFIVAELAFKITRHFLYRFLEELEQELTEPGDIKNVRYFRQLLSEKVVPEETEAGAMEGDRAIQIVENFKQYILTGKRTDLEGN